ncbi:MAG: metal transporter, partial [Rhodopirellula bahusiensis]
LAGNPSLMDPSKAPSYSPGPLQLPETTPVMLAGQSAAQFDRAYDAYFEIQCAMSADTTPPPVALNTLLDALARLEMLSEVPDEAQSRFASARRGASRMDGSLETAREAYRSVSHALLKAATIARGPKTARSLVHMYCPMVPGGGGDWMQPGGELQNPYWGSEMLTCGETVRDLAMNAANGDGQEVSFKVVGFGTDTGEMQ